MSQKINGNLNEFLTDIKNSRASFTHLDVHVARDGDSSAALESAATNKPKEDQVGHDPFLYVYYLLPILNQS